MTPTDRNETYNLINYLGVHINSDECSVESRWWIEEAIKRLRSIMLEEEQLSDSKPTPEPDWLSIYQAYPRKVGRPSARKAILKALKSKDHASLLASVQRYAEYVKAAKTEECYIPHCSRWMNDERYNDPLPDPMAANPALRNAKVAHLKSVIRNSPAFPGGPRWTELHTPEEKSKYTEAASELLRFLPGFNMNELRR